jgi:hypothetical protein
MTRRRDFVPSRSSRLQRAVAALRQAPLDEVAMQETVDSVCEILNSPRRRNRASGLSRRLGAILRTHTRLLEVETVARIRERCRERFHEIEATRKTDVIGSTVTEQQAALRLGLTLSDLHFVLRDPLARRELGWPRPIGRRVIFNCAALDPSTAREFLESMPHDEPWPQRSWPEGWR